MKRPTVPNVKPGTRLRYIGGPDLKMNEYYTVGKVYMVHDGTKVRCDEPIIPDNEGNGHGCFVRQAILEHFVFAPYSNVSLGYGEL